MTILQPAHVVAYPSSGSHTWRVRQWPGHQLLPPAEFQSVLRGSSPCLWVPDCPYPPVPYIHLSSLTPLSCLCTLSSDIRCKGNGLSTVRNQGPHCVGSGASNKPLICVCMYTHVYVYLLISTDKYVCNIQIPPSGSFLWGNSGVEGEMGIKNNF